MSEGQDDVESTDLEDLALFPLPGMVLFPGAVMPLHIFEARYRAMTEACLQTSRLLAMAKLREDDSGEQPPAVHPIAGLGRIEASRKLSDGRYYLLVRGIASRLPTTSEQGRNHVDCCR